MPKIQQSAGESPAVSVFVPYYNDGEFLAQCIESVLAQTRGDFELILLNHASTDGCRRTARSFRDPRIRHIDMPSNLGAGSGILILEFLKAARGKYAKLFCADDMMRPDCLERLVGYMEARPETDVAFGDMEYVDKNGRGLGTKWSLRRPHFAFGMTEAECLGLLIRGISFMPYPASIAKTEALREARIDKSMVMMLDMSVWAGLIIKGKKFGFIPDVVVNYRVHENQTSSSRRRNIALRRSQFESVKYCDAFYSIRDPELLKSVLSGSKFAQKIKSGETRAEIFEFAVAEYYLGCKNAPYKTNGYARMHDLMQDDSAREAIAGEFGFGIREFREMYSKPEPARKSAKEVGLGGLLYLLLRRLWIIVTFKDVKRRLRRRRTFTE